MKLIQLDADVQQVLINGLKPGLQALVTIDVDDLVDLMTLYGEETVGKWLGQELIDLLKTDGSILCSVDPKKYFKDIKKELNG